MKMKNEGSFWCFTATLLVCAVVTAVSSENITCGGDLKGPHGEFKSPNYPYNVPPNTTCEWKFIPDETSGPYVVVDFTGLELADDDVFEYMEPDNTTTRIQPNVQGFAVLAINPDSVITYKTGKTPSAKRGFSASYKMKDCTYYVEGSVGAFSFPVKHMSGNGSFECTWIVTSAPNTHSKTVFSFLEFNLGNSSITFFNGTERQQKLEEFSGSVLPSDVIGGSQVTVVLKLLLPLEEVNFTVRYSIATPECTMAKNVTKDEVLSPPVNVPFGKINCVWILRSKPNTTFLVRLDDINLNDAQDSLVLNDGLSLYSSNLKSFGYSSSETTKIMNTTSNELYVSYSSEQFRPGSAFKLSTEVLSGTRHFEKEGNFSLPPNSTESNSTVVFTFVVDRDKQVEVTISERSFLHANNQLVFYDTTDDQETFLANFSNLAAFYPVFSHGNRMRLEAKNFQGAEFFKGEFRGIPKGCDSISEGVTGSYQLSSATTNMCTWLILPSKSDGLTSLTLATTQLTGLSTLSVYSGLTKNKLVKKYETNSTVQLTLLIPAKEGVRIDVSRNTIITQNGSWFSGVYLQKPSCDSVVKLTDESISDIQNIGYPFQYPLNANCSWFLSVPPKKIIRLGFRDVNLYSNDSVQIHQVTNKSRTLITSLHGQSSVEDLLLSGEEFLIRWTSDVTNSEILLKKGFHIEVEVLDCGGNITTESKSVVPIPPKVNGTQSCAWLITVPIKSASEASNIDFYFEGGELKPNKTILEFHDGGSMTSPLIPTANATKPTFTRTNKLLVLYRQLNSTSPVPTYAIHATAHGCDAKNRCKNGICMHQDWRCNGINDCGDFSDETDCMGSAPPSSSGIAPAWLVLAIIMSLALGVALTVLTPRALRKYHDMRQNYHDFRTLPDA